MALFGLFVLGQAAYKFLNPVAPQFEIIGLIGLLALAANRTEVLAMMSLREHNQTDRILTSSPR